MACCAITSKYKDCRNWSCLDSKFCSAHKNINPESLKQRWLRRYVFGNAYTIFYRKQESKILSDLFTGTIVLTKEDILKIPARERYGDVYLLFMEHGFVERGTHKNLEKTIINLYNRMISVFPQDNCLSPLRNLIERTLILSSGKAFYEFLLNIVPSLANHMILVRKMMEHIPKLLDTHAAKELSWFSRDELDTIRVHYENILGKDHPLTHCLVKRWLLDIKELYQTEKSIQKIKMDQCKEQLMMNRWHPDRMALYLEEYGVSLDDM